MPSDVADTGSDHTSFAQRAVVFVVVLSLIVLPWALTDFANDFIYGLIIGIFITILGDRFQ